MSEPAAPVAQAFDAAALAIVAGDMAGLASLLERHDGLATFEAESGHPTLLQLVACEEAHIGEPEAIVEILLAAGAATTWPLIAAAGCNGQRTLQTLLDAGVDVDASNDWTPLDEALYWNQTEVIAMLLERGPSLDRLRRGAGLGDLALIETFFDNGTVSAAAGPIRSPWPGSVSDADASDQQQIVDHAFVMAVNCGHQTAASLLLERGAQVNAVPVGYHWKGTALHAAVWRGHTELVVWLLASGADPTIRDGLAHSDAAGWARHHDQPAIVALLKAVGLESNDER